MMNLSRLLVRPLARSLVPTTLRRNLTLEPQVKNLMELIFDQKYFAAAIEDFHYDAKKLPLGKLNKATISRGFQALKDLSAVLDDASVAADTYNMSVDEAIESLSNMVS